jgi:hypothetical protein
LVLTGSINQCTVEAAVSDRVKDLLQQLEVQDTWPGLSKHRPSSKADWWSFENRYLAQEDQLPAIRRSQSRRRRPRRLSKR